MKLDYKILWLDDKMDVILDGGYDAEVRNFLIEEGFNPIIITVKNEEEFFSNLDDTYDLIMTDYHLNEKEGTTRDGDVIIKEVREKNSIFTEIMFYSAQGEVVDTVKLDRITFVDTRKIVGSDHYEKLIGRAMILIELTIKKFQNIVAMRGMIMHETSSLDLKMEEIVRKQLNNPNLEEHITPLLNTIFDNIFVNAKEKYEKAEKRKIKDILRDNVLFNSSQKIYALGAILEIMKEENFASKYDDEVILIRNQFAHSELKINNAGKEYFKVKGEEIYFDKELCKKIRHNLNSYINKINVIESKLN